MQLLGSKYRVSSGITRAGVHRAAGATGEANPPLLDPMERVYRFVNIPARAPPRRHCHTEGARRRRGFH